MRKRDSGECGDMEMGDDREAPSASAFPCNMQAAAHAMLTGTSRTTSAVGTAPGNGERWVVFCFSSFPLHLTDRVVL